jgi:mRNA-degrading endonuclease YafQ of YafQ-DinJ toxin-antitoxin module
MIEVIWGSKFKRAYRKLILNNLEIDTIFWERVEIFQENPYHPFLKTHKLYGKLQDYMAFSIDYDLRVLFKFIDKTTVLLIDIGSHDVIY